MSIARFAASSIATAAATKIILEESRPDRFISDEITSYQTYWFSVNPKEQPNHAPGGNIVTVPAGYCFYWSSTSGKTWSDGDSGSRIDAGGYDYPDEEEWIDEAYRGQLVAHTNFAGKLLWGGYFHEFDSSRPEFSKVYINDSGQTLQYWWHMNDNWNYYTDNQGFMNCGIIVRPYQ